MLDQEFSIEKSSVIFHPIMPKIKRRRITSDTGIFDFVGIEPVEHLFFGSIGYLDAESYKDMLKEVESTINSYFS